MTEVVLATAVWRKRVEEEEAILVAAKWFKWEGKEEPSTFVEGFLRFLRLSNRSCWPTIDKSSQNENPHSLVLVLAAGTVAVVSAEEEVEIVSAEEEVEMSWDVQFWPSERKWWQTRMKHKKRKNRRRRAHKMMLDAVCARLLCKMVAWVVKIKYMV